MEETFLYMLRIFNKNVNEKKIDEKKNPYNYECYRK